jgi:hypothetical protein
MVFVIIHSHARRDHPLRALAFAAGVNMDFRLDDRAFLAMTRDLRDRDIRIAGVWALNDTAADVLSFIQGRMDVVFDRPTRFTKNAFHVWRANTSTMEARVEERPSVGKRHYLKVEETGGQRGRTGMEGRITLASPDPVQAIVSGEHARLDGHGNWSTGERNQVMAALQVGRDVGYSSNASETSAKRGKRRGRASYFVPKQGLAPGVYKRTAPGQPALRVLKFTTAMPTYAPRLGFYDGAEEVYTRQLPDHLSRTIARMVAKRAGG